MTPGAAVDWTLGQIPTPTLSPVPLSAPTGQPVPDRPRRSGGRYERAKLRYTLPHLALALELALIVARSTTHNPRVLH